MSRTFPTWVLRYEMLSADIAEQEEPEGGWDQCQKDSQGR